MHVQTNQINIPYLAVCFVLERLEKQKLGELIQHRLPKEITLMEGPKPVCCVCFACSDMFKNDDNHKKLRNLPLTNILISFKK